MLEFIILQASGKGEGSIIPTIVMFGAIILVFYFFMVRPQQKKQKEAKQFRDNLQNGDHIVTIGGLHGKVTEIGENQITIEVDEGVKVQVEKSAVSAENSKGSSDNTNK